jgi:ABC-type transport system substrate-binding protein
VEPGSDVTVGDGSVWVSRLGDLPEIVRLDAGTGEVQARIPDVIAYTVGFGEGALWYATDHEMGRIDAATNSPSFDPVLLIEDANLGNVAFGGGDAWVTDAASGRVFRLDRRGRRTDYAVAAGVGELTSTSDTMWVTNAENGIVTGIDLVTGEQERRIDTGHATVSVAAGGDQLMMAVYPTPDELIADLDGSVLTIATAGSPWSEPSPDPILNGNLQVRQALYLTCVGLLNYPDKPAPDGFVLEPEAAASMPAVSPDGRTYTFTIKPGFMFSPPSNEAVTAETFRATIERAVSPTVPDWAPGPNQLHDIVGVEEYRNGSADHVSGVTATGDQLQITLEAPAPDLLHRLAMPFLCPVPARTPVLLSGLDPDPPISGAGPYYLAAAGRRSHVMPRLLVLKKNPNYHGSRPQPYDNIAIRTKSSPETSIARIRAGSLGAAILSGDEPLSGALGPVAAEWGPGSPSAKAGRQRWFGAPERWSGFLLLNPSGPAFRDPDVRRAVSLALDRTAMGEIWGMAPSDQLLSPGYPGAAPADGPLPIPDLEAARALMDGRSFTVTMMGAPIAWDCTQCRDLENAVTGQLEAVGIEVVVRPADEDPAEAFDEDSGIDLLDWGSGSEIPDPLAPLANLHDIPWMSDAHVREIERLADLSGQPRIDGAAALAREMSEEQALLVPYGYAINPFAMSEEVGCGFVQPALGLVDLLSLCAADAAPGAAPSAGSSP